MKGKNPLSPKELLKDLTEELKELIQNGITEDGAHFEVKIKVFMTDAPGRALMQGIKGHSGFRSCPRGKIVGTNILLNSGNSAEVALKVLKSGRTLRTRRQLGSATGSCKNAAGQKGRKKKKSKGVICFLETEPEEPRTEVADL